MALKDRFEEYVRRSLRDDAKFDFGLGILSACAGLVILWVFYTVVYAIVALLTPLSLGGSRMVALAVLGLCFLEAWRDRRKLFEQVESESSDADSALGVTFAALGAGFGSYTLIWLSSPAHARNAIRVLADFLCAGPRLLFNAYRLHRRALARRNVDADGCARILTLAFNTEDRLPLQEIVDWEPDIDHAAVLEQLTWTGGIILIRNPPPGIVLTESFRAKLEEVAEEEGDAEVGELDLDDSAEAPS